MNGIERGTLSGNHHLVLPKKNFVHVFGSYRTFQRLYDHMVEQAAWSESGVSHGIHTLVLESSSKVLENDLTAVALRVNENVHRSSVSAAPWFPRLERDAHLTRRSREPHVSGSSDFVENRSVSSGDFFRQRRSFI